MRHARCAGFVLTSALLVLSCKSSASGIGGETNSRELARQAIHLSLEGGAFGSLVDQAIASTLGGVRNRIEGSGRHLSIEQTQQLETAIRSVFLEVYPRESWEEAMVPLYLNGFENSELREVVRFQQTALGRKLSLIQAQVATGGGGIGQQLIQSRQAEFSRRLGEQLTAAWGAGGVP